MELLIKYASFGRPQLMLSAIKNIYETVGIDDFKILLTLDTLDLSANNDNIRESLNNFDERLNVVFGDRHTKVYAINRDLHISYNWNWKWLVNMSDDMRFIRKDWACEMIKEIRGVWEDYDWFAHFNDGHVGDKLPTLSIIGREYFERTHRIYSPAYKSVSCDAEEMYVAMMLGKYHYFNNIYFHHIHPANGYNNKDYVYEMNNRYGDDDTETYFKRLSKLFYVNNPKIIPNEIRKFLGNIDSNN